LIGLVFTAFAKLSGSQAGGQGVIVKNLFCGSSVLALGRVKMPDSDVLR